VNDTKQTQGKTKLDFRETDVEVHFIIESILIPMNVLLIYTHLLTHLNNSELSRKMDVKTSFIKYVLILILNECA